MQELDFNWLNDSDDLPGDTLDRAKYARFLTKFLAVKGKEQNYVLNINSPWGTGKTWFLRRWMNEIKNVYPTIYINAWKSDHSNDPFLSVISEIKSQLITRTDKSFIQSSGIKHSWMLMKSAAPAILKSIIKNKAGVDIDTLSDGFIDADCAGDISEKLVETLISSHEASGKSVEEFKVSITQWLEAVVGQKQLNYPLFIFIDELDRCRPTYAIEMLETIKHIFDLKGVVFVVATDREQLQHSIRAIYGDGFDSQRYLERFFQRSVTLHRPATLDFIANVMSKSQIIQSALLDETEFNIYYQAGYPVSVAVKVLANIADELSMEPRTIKKWIERIEAGLSVSPRADIIVLSYMLSLYTFQTSLFEKIKSGDNIYDYKMPLNLAGRLTKFQLTLNTTHNFNKIARLTTRNDIFNNKWQHSISISQYCVFFINILKRYDAGGNSYTTAISECVEKANLNEQAVQFHGPEDLAVFKIPLTLYMLTHERINDSKMSFRHYVELCELATTLD